MSAVTETYTLSRFVEDLRAIAGSTSETNEILKQVRPLALRLAASPDLRARCTKECDDEQGFGIQLLHEEPDHNLAVALVNWMPGRGTPPHDHGTWGIVAGVEGDEINTFWKRVDDGTREGYAELKRLADKVCAPGDSLGLTPEMIHSVRNDSAEISVSLHVYGRHINHTNRSRFDPDAKTVTPWVVATIE